MELIAKLHGRMGSKETPFQDKYGDNNIGFEKLFELEELGFVTKKHDVPFAKAWSICVEESKAGRFPLVSLPTEVIRSLLDHGERLGSNRHIFITHLNPHLTLIFHYHGAIGPALADPRDIERQVLALSPAYEVNLATYVLK
jgi:hypothetical protein